MNTEQIIEKIKVLHDELQSQQPLVHCITNTVASNFAANVVLAIGASPAMIDNPFEAEGFAGIAHALNINIGTPTSEQIQAMFNAVKGANKSNVPWVLDPVGYSEILNWRSQTIDLLIQNQAQIIRGNASEIAALSGRQVISKGVDSTLNSDQAINLALSLLNITNCVAISGQTDYILSQEYGIVAIQGGSALQPKVTAMGCALGAVCAAYHGLTTSSALAAIAAHAHFALAAKKAERKAQGIGSFQMYFLDELYHLQTNDFDQLRIQFI